MDRSAAVTLVPKGQEVNVPQIDAEMEAFMSQVQRVQSLADIAAMSVPTTFRGSFVRAQSIST